MHPQGLPYAEVQHDLLASSGDGIGPDVAVQALDLGALSAPAVAQTAEDLAGLASAELEGRGALGLQAGDGAAELEHGLHVAHLLALVDEVLEPRVRGLDLAGHVGELETDDRVLDELLAERAALVRVLDALLVADAAEADALDDDADTLVVEVGHDDLEALVLLADEVLDGDFDVLEGHVGSTGAPDTLAVHSSGAHATLLTLNQQDGDTVHAFAASSHGGGEVVGPDTVGNPLLLAVDNVVLAILGQLGLAGQVGDVATSIRFGDGQADALVTSKDTGEDAVDEFFLSVLEHWRASNTETADEVPDETSTASPRDFVCEQHLVEKIVLLRCDALYLVLCQVGGEVCSQETGEITALSHLLVDCLGDPLGLIPLGDIRHDLAFDPFPDLGTESGVGFVEVRRVVLR